jgi:hypothetical protein
MTTPKVTVGDPLTWREIHPDGRDLPRSGHIWAPAAPVAGSTAFWVLPDLQDQGEDSSPAEAILVARSSRRHLVGRAYRIRKRFVTGEMGWREMWNPTGGRFVDKGEWFRETDPRSRFNRIHRPPTHAAPRKRPDPASKASLDHWCKIINDAADGADIDFSVKAEDVANAAEIARNVDAEDNV